VLDVLGDDIAAAFGDSLARGMAYVHARHLDRLFAPKAQQGSMPPRSSAPAAGRPACCLFRGQRHALPAIWPLVAYKWSPLTGVPLVYG
jgi:hypothetical protein